MSGTAYACQSWAHVGNRGLTWPVGIMRENFELGAYMPLGNPDTYGVHCIQLEVGFQQAQMDAIKTQ